MFNYHTLITIKMIKYISLVVSFKKIIIIFITLLISWLINIYNIMNLLLNISHYTYNIIFNNIEEVIVSIILIYGCYNIIRIINKIILIKKRDNNKLTSILDFTNNTHKYSENITKDNTLYLTNYKYTDTTLYLIHIINSLIIYYRDPINIFFLSIGIGQLYLYSDIRTLIPVFIFSILAMIQYINEKYDTIKQQNIINNKLINRNNIFIKQSNLRRGEIITLTDNDEIPADILILSRDKIIVNELELTGENIDIKKKNLNIDNITSLTINHYQNTGSINDINYNYDNIIFRGTKIIDGKVTGIIIETGNDCQMYKINYNYNKNKTIIEELIDNICKKNLMLLILLVLICGTDIVIDKWTKIPDLLKEFSNNKPLITNICHWIIMKHMLSAFTLLGMLLTSYYEQLRDPTNPILMASLNGILFLYMIKYVKKSKSQIISNNYYEQGLILGLINGLYVFNITNYEEGIYLAIASIFIQLIIKMMTFDDKNILNIIYYILTSSIILLIIYFVSNLSYNLFLEYMIFTIISYMLIARFFIN